MSSVSEPQPADEPRPRPVPEVDLTLIAEGFGVPDRIRRLLSVVEDDLLPSA